MKDKQLRKELILYRISKIKDNVSIVKENLPEEFKDFKKARLLKDAIYKEIEFSIELVFDICAIINSDLRLGTPETEENIITNIEIKKVFSEKIINIIKNMKRFRNLLVHKYGDIDDEKAFESISEGLNDFDLIIKEIENVLKKYNGKKEKK